MGTKANISVSLVIFVLLIGSLRTATAGTIYVDANGTGDYATIELAVNAATTGDTIILEPGVYTGSGNWDINLQNKAIVLQSQDPDKPQIIATTVIDCNDQGHNGFIFNSGETSQTIIYGLSITNSTGAIFCENQSSPTIRNCNFYGNNGSYAISCAAGSPVIDKCVVQGNLSGGGVLCGWQSTGPSSGYVSQPTIIESSIYGNSGNGMELVKGSPTVINTSITANGYYGVDGQNFGFPPPDFLSTPLFINCLIAGNVYGGVHLETLFGGDFDATFQNCTIAENYYIGIHFHGYGTNINLRNSIIAYNCDYQGGYPQIYSEYMYGEAASMTISYSNVPEGLANIQIDPGSISRFFWGAGNIESEPNFVNLGYWSNPTPGEWGDEIWYEGNYRLQWFSECIDTADNTAVPADTEDLDEDLNTTEPIPYDLDGHPRIVDGDCNSTDVVDMGAYEFSYVWLGDFAGGCDVDFADFSILALAWLTEEGQLGYNPNCDIAVPYDDVIDEKDLQVFTDNWLLGR